MAKTRTVRAFALALAVLTTLSPSAQVAAAHPSESLASRPGGLSSAISQIAQADSLGNGAYAVAVGDFNGDGKTDVALTNDGDPGEVTVFLSNGDGSFKKAKQFASGGVGALSIVAADFNQDGKVDLAVANDCFSGTDCSQASVGVLLGRGNGTFRAAKSYAAGGNAYPALGVGDFNGDGIPDLVMTTEGQVIVLLANPNGTFQPGQSFDAGGTYIPNVQVADINGDGKKDIVLASSCNGIDTCVNGSAGVSVLLGNGDGTFQAPLHYSFFGWFTFSVAVGDFNGDGKLDLAAAVQNNCRGIKGCTPDVVNILLGNGDGTFQPGETYATVGSLSASAIGVGPENLLTTGDFNNDGKDDLAVVSPCATKTDCSNGELRVFLGKGNGTFKISERKLPLLALSHSIAVGDFNTDGNPDLVIAAFGGTSVLLGNGKGTFQVEP
jgi:hypothetical protein